MFVRNKIYWYSSRLNPSSPPLSTLAAAAGSGTAPTLVPFYLRRVSTPSASPSEPRATPSSSSRRFPSSPHSATGSTNRPTPGPSQPWSPLNPPTKRHGSHGGSYGINKSGAHAPQLPSLLPSAATPHPFALPSLCPTTLPPFQPTLLCLFLSHLLLRCLALSFPPSRTGIPLAAAMDFVLSPQPTTLNRANFHLPYPSSLSLPSWCIHPFWNYG